MGAEPSVTYYVTLDNGELASAYAANPLFPNQRVDLTREDIDKINRVHANVPTAWAYEYLKEKYKEKYR